MRQALLIVPLILHALAVFSICHLVYLQLRQDPLGRRSWGGWAWRSLNVVFLIYYVFYLWRYLAYLLSYGATDAAPRLLWAAYHIAAASIGALLMQVVYASEHGHLKGRLWRTTVGGAWALSVATMIGRGLQHFTAAGAGYIPIAIALDHASLALGVLLGCAMLLRAGTSKQTTFNARQWKWYFVLASLVLGYLITYRFWYPWYFDQLVLRFLPFIFLLVTTYYGERQVFFDLCAKRGLFFLFSLVAAVAACTVLLHMIVLPRIWVFAAWFIALPVLPLILAAPWFYSWLAQWVDRKWLGRRFSPADAAEYFARELQDAVSEPELLECAEASLSHIFRSPACVEVEAASLPGAADELTATFGGQGRRSGIARVLPRNDGVPFLSEDQTLLAHLARSLGALLENQRLRDENTQRLQRERELQLNATQSELKALRAQINPHFLFNALGAIAALIRRDPARAEETVEQLAGIFRYTLRRSEREWVRLQEELEFVESYLYIERARFGKRLQVQMEIEDEVKDVRVPAMVLQTLVENAIKHGVASVRGQGLVAISARRRDTTIVLTVADNGPGFSPAGGAARRNSGIGYGLKNVHDRLRGYYGEEARLHVDRDTAAGTTLVSIAFPVAAAEAELARRN